MLHPSAMPKGSVLYISVVTGHLTNAKKFGVFTRPQVLKEDRLPSCAR